METKEEILEKVSEAIDAGNYYIMIYSNDRLDHWLKNIEIGTIDHKLHQLQFWILFEQYHTRAHGIDFKSLNEKKEKIIN